MKLLLLLLLAATAFAQDVRVLTFNIRYSTIADGRDAWIFRREAVANLIADNADIAGLQEVKPGQREWLAGRLPEFAVIGVGREPGDKDEAVPILYRKDRFEAAASGTFWLSDKPEEPGSRSFGNTLPRICTWARLRDKMGGTFTVFNVHLDHASPPARERGIALVLDRIAAREAGGPALLTGDFNSSVDDAPIKGIAARERPALISTYTALGVPTEGTFHAFTGKPNTGAIDFIFMEKGRWRVKSGEVLKTTYPGVDGTPRFVSDHFPVQAVIEPVK